MSAIKEEITLARLDEALSICFKAPFPARRLFARHLSQRVG